MCSLSKLLLEGQFGVISYHSPCVFAGTKAVAVLHTRYRMQRFGFYMLHVRLLLFRHTKCDLY